MQASLFTTVFLPLALAIIMLGLGLSLTKEDFKRVLVYPRAVFVGLLAQMLLLPAVAYGLAKGLDLPPELAVGLMLLAASPGGATANLFSHLAHGDVALNITLTATNSLLSLFTLPFFINMSLNAFMGEDKAIPLQTGKVVSVVLIILIPVLIGMAIRKKKPDLATRLDKPVRIISAVFLFSIIGATVVNEGDNLWTMFRVAGVAALVFNLASMGVGYLLPRLFQVPEKQAVAIGMEIGIHNGTLAITIASTLLGNPKMAIAPAIYSLIMFVTATLFGLWAAKRTQQTPA